MTPRRLILRVDGGPGIGWGHAARCFGLAQAWVDDGGAAIVASSAFPPEWAERCHQEGVEVRGPQLVEYADADWVVIDGYHFTETERRAIAADSSRLGVIDDHGYTNATVADVIVDQNLGATSTVYTGVDRHPTLLLGPRYALLRREFAAFRAEGRSASPEAQRLLVSLGGAPSPASATAFERALGDERLAGLERVRLSGVDEVAAVMAGADLALAAAGATCWELCCMGVPAVLVSLADNQVPLARALAARGIAVDAGSIDTVDPSELAQALVGLSEDPSARARMSRSGQELVDGGGAQRVVAALHASADRDATSLRALPTD